MSSPDTEMFRVAAILATMNRKDTAIQCVTALARQSRAVDLTIVLDNGSQDETVAALHALGPLPFPLVIHEMDSNRGNAGGVEKGMELAFNAGANVVWILDDDSWPRPDSLEEMLFEYHPAVVRHPLQIDPATHRFTWPILIQTSPDERKLVWDEQGFGEKRFLPTSAAWTGVLISKEIYLAAGPVKGDLFIRGEDEEYPLRIARLGYRFELARRAVLDHPGPAKLLHWNLFGKNFFFEPGLPDWKLFYKVRNMVWLKKQEAGVVKAALMALTYATAVLKTDGTRRIPVLWKAICDGWMGRLGKLPN